MFQLINIQQWTEVEKFGMQTEANFIVLLQILSRKFIDFLQHMAMARIDLKKYRQIAKKT